MISFFILVKLNGGRHVIGFLRGFDPFMNFVVDETVEVCKDGSKKDIGMVVSISFNYFALIFFKSGLALLFLIFVFVSF